MHQNSRSRGLVQTVSWSVCLCMGQFPNKRHPPPFLLLGKGLITHHHDGYDVICCVCKIGGMKIEKHKQAVTDFPRPTNFD